MQTGKQIFEKRCVFDMFKGATPRNLIDLHEEKVSPFIQLHFFLYSLQLAVMK